MNNTINQASMDLMINQPIDLMINQLVDLTVLALGVIMIFTIIKTIFYSEPVFKERIDTKTSLLDDIEMVSEDSFEKLGEFINELEENNIEVDENIKKEVVIEKKFQDNKKSKWDD